MTGKTLGNWQIERLLAKGGMGEVYLARHNRLGTLAAVKVLKVLPPLLSSDAELRQRFFQEAQTQAHLRHAHIAQILDFIEEGGSLFQLIEYLPGGTLADVQHRSGNPPLPLVMTWTKQVLAALAYAHDCGIIHRDIKPSNILLDHHGDAKLTDFGIALVLGDKRLTSTGKFLGTPEYMSPEQITMPKTIDARSDIYSMGIVLFELLTGRVPFTGETDYAICQSQVNDKLPDIGPFNSSVPPSLEDIVKTALQKNPVERFQTCKEFLHSLEGFEQSQPYQGVRPTRVGRDQSGRFEPERGLGHLGVMIGEHPRLWMRARWLITAAVLLMAVAFAWFIYVRPRIVLQSVPPEESKLNGKITQKAEMTPEHLLATLSDEELHSLRTGPLLSPRGDSIAYKIKLANQFYVVINGVRGPACDQVALSEDHAFSEDGSKFAYCALQGTRYVIIVNNQITREFQIDPSGKQGSIAWFPPQFSPHGETLLYVALKGGKFCAVAGDREGPTFDFINDPQFSADGTTIAYIAEQNQKSFVVVGDRTEPSFDAIRGFAISRDGGKVAYIARETIAGSIRKPKQKQFVVSGDWRSPTYVSEPHDVLSGLQLSSDGDELMYSVDKAKKRSLVLHGKQEAEYEGVDSAFLSPDGNSIAFDTKKDGKYCIVINGRSGPAFDDVVVPVKFSDDSSRLAYLAKVGNKVLVVCGDRRGPEYDLVSFPVVRFSADGSNIGYTAWIGNELWWKTLDLR